MIDPAYVEAIVAMQKEAVPQVERWFTQRGLQPLAMRTGLLVTGARSAFEAALGVDLSDAEPPVQIPVPPELRDTVSSITIPPPRRTIPS